MNDIFAAAHDGQKFHRSVISASAVLLLAACSPSTADRLASVREVSSAGEPTTGTTGTLAASFPVAIRGEWRETDGPAPTSAQCDRGDYGNAGRVLTVEAQRFSYFEEGGRLLEVKERSAGHLRAIFDTSYAEPRQDDLAFDVDPVARTLTVIEVARGSSSRRVFRRCPR